MGILTQTNIGDEVKDLIVANVATDAPIAAAELQRAINAAYAMVWEAEGGAIKTVASATAWTNAQLCTGRVMGILTDINQVLHIFATTTAPFALTTVTATNTTLTSAALFGNVVAGMTISGTGIPANTFVASVTDASNLTMTLAATDATSNSRTFSPTSSANELDKADEAYIQWLLASDLPGTYATPKLYAIGRQATVVPAGVGLHKLYYYPAVTGFYFPMEYQAQFTPLDGGSVTTPDVTDIGSYDIAKLAAADLVTRIGRAELVPNILRGLSDLMTATLKRKQEALVSADQDA